MYMSSHLTQINLSHYRSRVYLNGKQSDRLTAVEKGVNRLAIKLTGELAHILAPSNMVPCSNSSRTLSLWQLSEINIST